jgi:hypothetical protein
VTSPPVIRKQQVLGSIPSGGSTLLSHDRLLNPPTLLSLEGLICTVRSAPVVTKPLVRR